MNIHKIGLSMRESALAGGVGRTTLYDQIRRGNLVAKKIGRRTVILREDLEHWLKTRQNSRGGSHE